MTPEHDNTNPPLTRTELAELKRADRRQQRSRIAPGRKRTAQQMLAASREARSVYIAYMQLDADLDWKVRGNQSVDAVVESSRQTASSW